MLRINFEPWKDKYPEYSDVFYKLQGWSKNHPDASYLNPRTLARELFGVKPVDLAQVLTMLTKARVLKRTYKVLTPSGVFADDEFEDPTKIPDKLPDRFEKYFDTSDADIVPVFREAK